MSERLVRLDVREDIRAGREPFTRIMGTVADLGIGQALLLIAPFEPVPLFSILERRGFSHQSHATESGDWEVLFSRSAAPSQDEEPSDGPDSAPEACARDLEVDARGLEPPQPLVTILEALSTLPEGATLQARTDRRPMHLYAQLEERGFTGQTQAQADGSFITLIRRAARP